MAGRLCSVSGCGKPHYGNGYCCAHNRNFKKYGSVEPQARSSPGSGLKFLREKVLTYEGDECLIWPYGRGKRRNIPRYPRQR